MEGKYHNFGVNYRKEKIITEILILEVPVAGNGHGDTSSNPGRD